MVGQGDLEPPASGGHQEGGARPAGSEADDAADREVRGHQHEARWQPHHPNPV